MAAGELPYSRSRHGKHRVCCVLSHQHRQLRDEQRFFASSGVDNGPVHLLQDGVNGGNGVYAYSASSTFPSNTYQSSNYWVDVVFTVGGGGPTPLNVSSTTPIDNATGVSTVRL